MLSTHSGIGKHLTEAREKQRIFAHGRRKIVVTQTIVVILVHLFQGDLHQFFDVLIGIFVTGLLERAEYVRSTLSRSSNSVYLQDTAFEQLEDLFASDMFFTFERIAIECN